MDHSEEQTHWRNIALPKNRATRLVEKRDSDMAAFGPRQGAGIIDDPKLQRRSKNNITLLSGSIVVPALPRGTRPEADTHLSYGGCGLVLWITSLVSLYVPTTTCIRRDVRGATPAGVLRHLKSVCIVCLSAWQYYVKEIDTLFPDADPSERASEVH